MYIAVISIKQWRPHLCPIGKKIAQQNCALFDVVRNCGEHKYLIHTILTAKWPGRRYFTSFFIILTFWGGEWPDLEINLRRNYFSWQNLRSNLCNLLENWLIIGGEITGASQQVSAMIDGLMIECDQYINTRSVLSAALLPPHPHPPTHPTPPTALLGSHSRCLSG